MRRRRKRKDRLEEHGGEKATAILVKLCYRLRTRFHRLNIYYDSGGLELTKL